MFNVAGLEIELVSDLNVEMATRHSIDFRVLTSLSRVNLLRELQTRGPLTVRELASTMGLHHNTTREHLHKLIDAGLVDSEPMPSPGRGRPQLRYRSLRGVTAHGSSEAST